MDDLEEDLQPNTTEPQQTSDDDDQPKLDVDPTSLTGFIRNLNKNKSDPKTESNIDTPNPNNNNSQDINSENKEKDESPEPMMYQSFSNDDTLENNNNNNNDNNNANLSPVDMNDEKNIDINTNAKDFRNNFISNDVSNKYYDQLKRTKEHTDKLFIHAHVKAFTKTKTIKREYIVSNKKLGIKTICANLNKPKKATIWYINTIVPGYFKNVYNCYYDYNNHRKNWDGKVLFSFAKNVFYKNPIKNNDELVIIKQATNERMKIFNKREYVNIGKLYEYNAIEEDKWGSNPYNSKNANDNIIRIYELISFCGDLVDPTKWVINNAYKDKDDSTKKIEKGKILLDAIRFYDLDDENIKKLNLPKYMQWTRIEHLTQIDDNLVGGWTPKYVQDKMTGKEIIDRYDAFREYLFECANLIPKKSDVDLDEDN